MKKIIFCIVILAGCSPATVNETTAFEKDSVEANVPEIKTTPGYDYEPAITTLVGQIEQETFWGPPGYGEDTLIDSKEVCDVLTLEVPIDIHADNSSDFNAEQADINRFQLLIKKDQEKFYGKFVEVKGKLFGAQTGHHHTQVLMEVTDVKELK